MRRLATIAVALIAGALAGGAAVWAQGSADTIAACTLDGPSRAGAANVRILAPGESCDPDRETAVVWNQQGPAGPPGERGPAGAEGTVARAPEGLPPVTLERKPVKRPVIKIPKPKKPKLKFAIPTGYLYEDTLEETKLNAGATKTVARVELPAGRYHVLATAEVQQDGPSFFGDFGRTFCRIEWASGISSNGQVNELDEFGTFTLQTSASRKKPFAVELRCFNLTSSSQPVDQGWSYARDVRLSALSVAGIVQQ